MATRAEIHSDNFSYFSLDLAEICPEHLRDCMCIQLLQYVYSFFDLPTVIFKRVKSFHFLQPNFTQYLEVIWSFLKKM